MSSTGASNPTAEGGCAPHSKLVAADVRLLIPIPERGNEFEPTHVGLLQRAVGGRAPAPKGSLGWTNEAKHICLRTGKNRNELAEGAWPSR